MAEELHKRTLETIRLLRKQNPNPHTALNHSNPLEMLVATMLSAQCTDKRVNMVTEKLFKKYRAPKDYAEADLKELEQDIRSINFYQAKARNIKNANKMLTEKFNSQVPDNMDDLVQLPGVARKTANVVLSSAFHKAEGIAVDTHVRRVSQRLGLTGSTDPNKIEQDLMRLVPPKDWIDFSHLLIQHGREVCTAKHPRCAECVLNKICPSAFKFD